MVNGPESVERRALALVFRPLATAQATAASPPDWFLPDGSRLEEADAAADLTAAARQALARGVPLLLTMPCAHRPDSAVLMPLLDAARARSGVVAVGRRAIRTTSWLQRLLFRLQTGISLADPASTWRVFPVFPLVRIKSLTRGRLLDAEVLVRAAWGGLPIVEVALPASDPPHPPSPWRPLRERLLGFLLHLHLVMRAVMPLPHVRLAEGGKAATVISLRRPLQTLRILLLEKAAPSQLAAAAALGVLLGTLPLVALHSLVILMAAGFLRLNRLLALGTSQLCMPPLVPALCIEVGHRMRHGRWLTDISIETVGHQALERLWEWLLGSLLLAPVLALLAAVLIYAAALLVRRQMASSRLAAG